MASVSSTAWEDDSQASENEDVQVVKASSPGVVKKEEENTPNPLQFGLLDVEAMKAGEENAKIEKSEKDKTKPEEEPQFDSGYDSRVKTVDLDIDLSKFEKREPLTIKNHHTEFRNTKKRKRAEDHPYLTLQTTHAHPIHPGFNTIWSVPAYRERFKGLLSNMKGPWHNPKFANSLHSTPMCVMSVNFDIVGCNLPIRQVIRKCKRVNDYFNLYDSGIVLNSFNKKALSQLQLKMMTCLSSIDDYIGHSCVGECEDQSQYFYGRFTIYRHCNLLWKVLKPHPGLDDAANVIEINGFRFIMPQVLVSGSNKPVDAHIYNSMTFRYLDHAIDRYHDIRTKFHHHQVKTQGSVKVWNPHDPKKNYQPIQL